MNRRDRMLVIILLLFALPIFIVVKGSTYEIQNNSKSEKCSAETEGLKLCIKSSEITVNSGEPVNIELLWVNSSDENRFIKMDSSDYSVMIKTEKDETLIPVFQQRLMEIKKRLAKPNEQLIVEEEKELTRRITRGNGRDFSVQANQSRIDEIKLTDIRYDYDLTKKGKYSVTISRTIPSLEEGKAIEFVIDDIEIEVK